jgi:hypothetical protein
MNRRRRRRAGKTTYLAFSVSICSTIGVAIDAGLLRIKIVSSTASSRRRRRVSVLGAPLVSHVYHKKLMVPKDNFKFDFESQKLQEQQRVLLCCFSLSLSLSLSHTHTHTHFLRAILDAQQHQQQLHQTKHFTATTITHKTPSHTQTLSLTLVTKLRLQMKLPLTLVRNGIN